jgi:uncharacterized cupin superfamily protein
MTVDASAVVPVENARVRGGSGSVFSRPLIADSHLGSAIAGLALNRLPPGGSVGVHRHDGEEDFYFCVSGIGVVHDNGVDKPFFPGVFQITRSGETQGLRNTGAEDLVFLGGLLKTTASA